MPPSGWNWNIFNVHSFPSPSQVNGRREPPWATVLAITPGSGGHQKYGSSTPIDISLPPRFEYNFNYKWNWVHHQEQVYTLITRWRLRFGALIVRSLNHPWVNYKMITATQQNGKDGPTSEAKDCSGEALRSEKTEKRKITWLTGMILAPSLRISSFVSTSMTRLDWEGWSVLARSSWSFKVRLQWSLR